MSDLLFLSFVILCAADSPSALNHSVRCHPIEKKQLSRHASLIAQRCVTGLKGLNHCCCWYIVSSRSILIRRSRSLCAFLCKHIIACMCMFNNSFATDGSHWWQDGLMLKCRRSGDRVPTQISNPKNHIFDTIYIYIYIRLIRSLSRDGFRATECRSAWTAILYPILAVMCFTCSPTHLRQGNHIYTGYLPTTFYRYNLAIISNHAIVCLVPMTVELE